MIRDLFEHSIISYETTGTDQTIKLVLETIKQPNKEKGHHGATTP